MKNTFGTNISLTLYGESHGESIGAVLDGLPAGLAVDEKSVRRALELRRPAGEWSTARRERDEFSIESGVLNGHTTGTPVLIRIPNEDTRSKDYNATRTAARPGHADLTAEYKYGGFQDARGGGHFSGRITAGLVAAGAILRDALERKNILIATRIASVADVCDRPFENIEKDAAALKDKPFAVLDDTAGERMKAAILAAKAEGDSVGGVLETVVTGLPGGVGEPWFDSVESVLSHALFSIPAVKGVAFGDGFSLSSMRGSEANDEYFIENGKIVTRTRHNGGVTGGITDGMPVFFRVAIKPTPTISKQQRTVDFKTMEETTIAAKGRHDPCIVHRARIVADSVTALALCDLLTARYGTEWLK